MRRRKRKRVGWFVVCCDDQNQGGGGKENLLEVREVRSIFQLTETEVRRSRRGKVIRGKKNGRF